MGGGGPPGRFCRRLLKVSGRAALAGGESIPEWLAARTVCLEQGDPLVCTNGPAVIVWRWLRNRQYRFAATPCSVIFSGGLDWQCMPMPEPERPRFLTIPRGGSCRPALVPRCGCDYPQWRRRPRGLMLRAAPREDLVQQHLPDLAMPRWMRCPGRAGGEVELGGLWTQLYVGIERRPAAQMRRGCSKDLDAIAAAVAADEYRFCYLLASRR